MNAAQKNSHAETVADPFVCLSAWADGEASVLDIDALLAMDDGAEVQARWHSYQMVSEALRGSVPAAGSSTPQVFLAGVMGGLPKVHDGALKEQPSAPVLYVRAPAANDAVMRWKVVAGFASVAAVMAVSWGVLQGAREPSAGGAQLALVEPVKAETPTQPVVVNTEQGPLIRDARLEQLLAEHRQFGGASALQMPAGFLRNATYGTASQR